MKCCVRISAYLITIGLLIGCQPTWSIEIIDESGKFQFGRQEFNSLSERFPENEYCDGVLLEQVLYENGIEVIDSIKFTFADGNEKAYSWMETAEILCISKRGELTNLPDLRAPRVIKVNEVDLQPNAVHITDIAPTVISALGISPDSMPGDVLISGKYQKVVLIFLDGFGFDRFQVAQQQGLISFQENADAFFTALTVYPPRTVTGSAAILTGLMPVGNGVDRGGIRKTDAETIFDVAFENELSSIAIEGESLAFNLRNTDVVLSGDRDQNGGTDDNVFDNAMDVINKSMPGLLWIHFHGIDDFGHTYGPDDPLVDGKILEINSYLEQIYDALPQDTLIIYFADHGMHNVHEEGRMGNHGHLIYEDMVVPVIIKTK